MPTGYTSTSSLNDSLPTMINAARLVRDQKGVMPQIVAQDTLPENSGLSWNEVDLAALTAQLVGETTSFDNPQQISDTIRTIVPYMTGIHTIITDRAKIRLSANVVSKLGALAQNAIQRLKDTDGLAVFAGAATTLAGSGTVITSGYPFAGVRRISSNVTEPGMPPYRVVLHGFQIVDIEQEIIAGVGTYPLGTGLTENVFKEGFRGMIGGGQLYEDGNITITANDARGGVFAEEAIILIQGRRPRIQVIRNEKYGGGAEEVLHYDEYAYGERSAGNWLFGILGDASVPTS